MYNRWTTGRQNSIASQRAQRQDKVGPSGFITFKGRENKDRPLKWKHANPFVMAAVHCAMSHTSPEASLKGLRQLCKHSLSFVQLSWNERDAYTQGSTKQVSFSMQNNVIRIQIFLLVLILSLWIYIYLYEYIYYFCN